MVVVVVVVSCNDFEAYFDEANYHIHDYELVSLNFELVVAAMLLHQVLTDVLWKRLLGIVFRKLVCWVDETVVGVDAYLIVPLADYKNQTELCPNLMSYFYSTSVVIL